MNLAAIEASRVDSGLSTLLEGQRRARWTAGKALLGITRKFYTSMTHIWPVGGLDLISEELI
jgi:hypothetical protein